MERVIRCPACSRQVPPGQFCVSCGARLPGSSEIPTRLESPATPHSSTPDHGRFLPGAALGGRYRIVALLGRGGMGEVYRADDLKLGQPVALKFLPEGIQKDEARLSRFMSEARIARQVGHANVCRVYDVGEVDGHHFLSMEYVDGEDLASLLRRIGRLPADKGIEIARQVSAGLAAAHDAGVLHRDLKPSNIMIDGRGRARITDFGLASLAEEVLGGEARSGTPAYMAPEQLSGKEATRRSDLYALGLVLYELFTGKHAFKGATAAELLRQQTSSSPASPSSVVPEVDPAVERVILRCLNPDPQGRPSSALAVAAALPGGDPLAEALAAGETPSPELVAAAGESEAGRLAVIIAMFGAILLGLILNVALAGRSQLVRIVPSDKPPAVLEEKARDLIASLGFTQPPADHLAAFDINDLYLRHVYRDLPPKDWQNALSGPQPAAVRFRYRESPAPLVKVHLASTGNWFSDPPPLLPGMVDVSLDPRGRLVAFQAVPEEQPPSAPGPEPDWTKLFSAAGLDPATLTAEPVDWVPPVFADHRALWKGTYPDSTATPIRVEAAALGGRIVMFRIREPWQIEQDKSHPARVRFDPAPIFRGVGLLAIFGGGFFIALRNLRLGRSDRKRALRFALYLGGVRFLWILGSHHLLTGAELDLVLAHLAWSMCRVGIVAVFYLAIEPYARRFWPRMLVSWMRILDGRLRDPLVGRDLLVGCLYGVGFAALVALFTTVPQHFGWRPVPPEVTLWTGESLRGLRHSLAAILALHTTSVVGILIPVMFLLLFRLALRRTWLAVAVTSILAAFSFLPEHPADQVTYLCMLPAILLLFWFVLFRFGLLSILLGVSIADLLRQMPLTLDLSSWYAAPSLLTLGVVLGIALWALRACLAGRRIVRDPILGMQEAG